MTLAFFLILNSICICAVGQNDFAEVKSELKKRYWQTSKICLNDSCNNYTVENNHISYAHYIESANCLNNSSCTLYFGQSRIVEEDKSNKLLWVYVSCSPLMQLKEKLSHKKYRIMYFDPEYGKVNGTLQILKNKIIIQGTIDEFGRYYKEFTDIKAPDSLIKSVNR